MFEHFHSCQSADGNFMCWEHGAARRKPNVKLRSAEVTTNKSLDVCHLEWVDPDFDKKLGLPCGRRLLSNCFQLTELFYTALLGRQKTQVCVFKTQIYYVPTLKVLLAQMLLWMGAWASAILSTP